MQKQTKSFPILIFIIGTLIILGIAGLMWKELEERQQSYDELIVDYDNLQVESAKLESSLIDKNEQNKKLAHQVSEYTEHINSLNLEKAGLEEQITTLRQEKENLEGQLQTKNNEIASLKKK